MRSGENDPLIRRRRESSLAGLYLLVLHLACNVAGLAIHRNVGIFVDSFALVSCYAVFPLVGARFFPTMLMSTWHLSGVAGLVLLLAAASFAGKALLFPGAVVASCLWLLGVREPRSEARPGVVVRALPVIGVALLTGAWATGINWLNAFHPHPLGEERIVLSGGLIDTVFHSAIVNIYDTFGSFGLGLNGVGRFDYHFGTHWFYSVLSSAIGATPLDALNYHYTDLLIPLLCYSFLCVMIDLRHLLKTAGTGSFGVLGCALLVFVGLAGFYPGKFLQLIGLNWGRIVNSESNLAGHLLLYPCLVVLLSRMTRDAKRAWWLLIPLLSLMFKSVKISSWYFFAGLLFCTGVFQSIRWRRWDRLLISLLAVSPLFLPFGNGSDVVSSVALSPGYFVIHIIKPLGRFFLFPMLVFAFLVLCAEILAGIRDPFASLRRCLLGREPRPEEDAPLLTLAAVLVMGVMSAVPPLLVSSLSHNGQYFWEEHHWASMLALGGVLACDARVWIPRDGRWKPAAIGVAFSVVCFGFHYWEKISAFEWAAPCLFSAVTLIHFAGRARGKKAAPVAACLAAFALSAAVINTAWIQRDFRKDLTNLRALQRESARSEDDASLRRMIGELKLLNTLAKEDKVRTAIAIHDDYGPYNGLKAGDFKPFLVPALSGIPFYAGGSQVNSGKTVYGLNALVGLFGRQDKKRYDSDPPALLRELSRDGIDHLVFFAEDGAEVWTAQGERLSVPEFVTGAPRPR